ncbi:MAG: MotA/TolQ/ExbB proton channel family protein [Candidatus Methanogaster sp.]|uniref:MotA/TolQ/ExbB proton channel family protein n=1 Tax=Candidatus Methanogaster sp. TaxID=3386292 RepID=A0AC61L2E8_9EURY|nr:MAG: MotA/TolQ/ExbB proton channel family protein [ANME-2 cluster archaeon]
MTIGIGILNLPVVLQNSIYIVSTMLLYPVIIALLLLTGYLIVEIGTFAYEHYMRFKRKRDLSGVRRARELSKVGRLGDALDLIGNSMSGAFVYAFIDDLRGIPIDDVLKVEIEKLLHEYDTLITKRLERTSLVARIGPMLGLMGTLIPMGPALAGLAAGDVELLANNMILAFGTTVLGLLVGGGSYAISTVRSRWYDQDMDDMSYICDMIYGDSDVSEE